MPKKKVVKKKKDKRIDKDSKTTMKQDLFCQSWVETVGNATEAALFAFDIKGKEILDKKAPGFKASKKPTQVELKANKEYWKERSRVESVASTMGREYLRKLEIRKRIDEILDEREFNDEGVKRIHFKLMNRGKDEVAIRGVDMYYKLKGKFAPDKLEVEDKTTTGEFFDPKIKKIRDKYDKEVREHYMRKV